MIILLALGTLLLGPLVALLSMLWSEGIIRALLTRHQNLGPQPPYAPSEKYPGQEAGWIETVVGLTGSEAPSFVLRAFHRIPKHIRWIFRGNFPNKAPSGCGYCVADGEVAHKIIMSKHCSKSIMYEGVDYLTCGYPNIFTSNGHRWKHARKQVAPAFSKNHIHRMVRICEEKLQTWIDTKLQHCLETRTSFNLGEEMVGLTLTIIAESAFEYDMTPEEQLEFTTNLETAAECFVIMNPLYLRFPYLFPPVWKANKAAKVVQSIAYRIIHNYRKKHANASQKEREFKEDTIISRIMNNPHYAHDDERASDIAIFMAAGHDTTAYSISWTLLEIMKAKPPELQAYRQAIQSLPQQEWRLVDDLHYMIKEGMRLQPVLAMGTVRDVGEPISYQQPMPQADGKTMKEVTVTMPKDSIYFINLFSLFRNPAYFDQPDDFVPSRWKNPTDTMTEVHTPFLVGNRNCIGQPLANAELHTVLGTLLGKYDFEIENEGYPHYLTTLKPVDCLLIPKKLET